MPNDRTRDNEQIKDQLQQEMRRTRLSPEQLSGLLASKASLDVSPEKIRSAIRKNTKRFAADEWREVVAFLSTLPNAPRTTGKSIGMQENGLRHGYIPITDQYLHELREEIARTNADINALVRDHETLTPAKVTSWKTRRVNTAPEEEWNYLLARLQALPDKDDSKDQRAKQPYLGRFNDYVGITKKQIHTIVDHRERTGVGVATLLEREGTPKGLRRHTVLQWLSGAIKTADPIYMAWVLQEYQALSDKDDN
ncbi:MAG: hypothetical protein KZQ96_20985 [Candidatus Thiodiazotropha sp. (ex Lucinoma borealis)]|nr:hypothetical protein [Candidatus Thiodiazotropha sp. (ex Lucinoma borealis)]